MCRLINEENEQWKWVDGFEGLYKISNRGKIMSFHHDPNGVVRSIKNANGCYLVVNMRGNGRKVTERVHVLVAKAFIGDIPDGYHVHHIDGNKQNNDVNNLEIISTKEHTLKTMAQIPTVCEGMNKYNKYERPKRVRQFTIDGQFIAEYVNSTVASHYTGVCGRNIIQVASKTEYKPGKVRTQAGGYVWRYAEEEK